MYARRLYTLDRTNHSMLLLLFDLAYVVLLYIMVTSLWSNRDPIGTNIVPFFLGYAGAALFIIGNGGYLVYQCLK